MMHGNTVLKESDQSNIEGGNFSFIMGNGIRPLLVKEGHRR